MHFLVEHFMAKLDILFEGEWGQPVKTPPPNYSMTGMTRGSYV